MALPPKEGEYDPAAHLKTPEAPRGLHYPENQADIEAYANEATVEAIVLIDRVFFNHGRQWGFYDETVKLSERDAKALAKARQVTIVAKK